jgi:hypothetical protein
MTGQAASLDQERITAGQQIMPFVWRRSSNLVWRRCSNRDPTSVSKRFHEVWEQAVNGASSIDFPVIRCRLSASWIGMLQFFGCDFVMFNRCRSRATPATRPFGPEWDLRLLLVRRTGQNRRAPEIGM